jgi:hypothetical protein
MGGYFWDTDNTGVAYLGYGNTGVRGGGSAFGGYFWDTDGTSAAYLAYGSWGIYTSNNAYFGGNVGIGTATPAATLHVQGGILSLIGSDPGAAVAAPFIRAQATTGFSSNPIYSFWYQSDTGMSNPAAQTIAFVTAGTERMRITSSGNVGIGTTTPAYKLDVNGNTRITGNLNVNGVLRVPSDEGQWGQIKLRVPAGLSYGPNESNIFRFSDPYGKYYGLYLRSGTDGLIKINDNGNVGIGTEFPEYKLDVAGDVRAGDVRMNTLRASNIKFCGLSHDCGSANPCTYDWDSPDITFAILTVWATFPSNNSYGRIRVDLRSGGSSVVDYYVYEHFETTPAVNFLDVAIPLVYPGAFDGVRVRLEVWDSTAAHSVTTLTMVLFYPCP